MTHSVRRRMFGGLFAAALAVSGLAVSVPATAETAEGHTAKVRINSQHEVKMTDELQPGVHRFVVRSEKAAAFQILSARRGYTKSEAARDANRMFENAKVMKRFERNITLIGGVSSRPGEAGVMWTRVTKGRYWVVDTMARQMQAEDISSFRVRGTVLAGGLPGASTLRADSKHSWAEGPQSIATSGRLVLRNGSDANHMFGIAKLKAGKTVDDFAAWIEELKKGNETAPPVRFDVGTESGVVGAGHAMSLRYDLPAGDYVLVCWWPDTDMGNMPHVMMGMFRGVHVG